VDPFSRAILHVQPNTQPHNADWKLSVRLERERGMDRRVEKERMRGRGEVFKLTSESFTLPASSLALINQATLRNVLSRRHRRFRQIRFRGGEAGGGGGARTSRLCSFQVLLIRQGARGSL